MTTTISRQAGASTPHGGELVDLLVESSNAQELRERAKSLPRVLLDARTASDLELLANGGFSPLRGFMTSDAYHSVLDTMHLPDGLAWSLPVTLAVSREQADALTEGSEVLLVSPSGGLLALLTVQEKYPYDRQDEARKAYRTDDPAHPGVAALYAQGEVLLGGPVRVLALPPHQSFTEHRLTPAKVRARTDELGWKTVVGFQTRNPVHRAHEYIQKCALEIVDGLLLHPLVGETKSDDIPAETRMRCYRVLLDNYYPANRTLLSVFPAAMRYAGPREAIFHAIVRKNYGCTHFIVGRDHAGVGAYYGTYDAQHIFREFTPEALGIEPLFFEHSFFCRACDSMASSKTCPHATDNHVVLSGTRVRQMLQDGEMPPVEFSRPEVAQILIDDARGQA